MEAKETTLRVKGMTCPACEGRIEKALLGIEGVHSAKANFRDGGVMVNFDPALAGEASFRRALDLAGYTVAEGRGRTAILPLGIGLLLVAVYLAVDWAGGFNLLPAVDSGFGYGMLFLAGVLTSFHCIAMCGGIALSQSLGSGGRPAEGPDPADFRRADLLPRLRPGLLYNSGRVLSYAVLGGAIGAAGNILEFSLSARAAITAAAGFFMLVLSLRALGFLRGLPRLGLPGPLSGLREKLRGRGPFTVGLLNGLMPCGPLQTMQLYALGTGSAFAGAFALLLFGLGTFPLMLAFGSLASALPRRYAFTLVRAGSVLILFFGLVTLGRALGLAGIMLPQIASAPVSPGIVVSRPDLLVSGGREAQGQAKATVRGNYQTVTTEMGASRYVPFTVQKGIPVRWTIRVSEKDLNGCNNAIVVPALGLKVKLKPGDTVVEFTPDKEGTLAYSCWMGMIRSKITVVSDLSGKAADDPTSRRGITATKTTA